MGLDSFTWKMAADSISPENASFGIGESKATMVIDVLAAGRTPTDIPTEILGYSYYDSTRTGKLARRLPMRHPLWRRLWATRITSFLGRKFNSKYVEPIDDVGHSLYEYYRVTIEFSCPPYTVLSDAEVDAIGGTAREFYRFVEKTSEPTIEALQKKGSRYVYAKVTPTTTGNGGLPPGAAATDTLDFGVIKRIGRANLKWVWYGVPANALFGNDGTDTPANIQAAYGKINDAAFPDANGFPAGTLLMQAPKFIPRDSPVEPNLLGLPPGYPPRTYDVEFNIGFFDPPTNPDWNGVGNAYPYRGWNLVPAQGASAEPYFYLPTAETATNGTGSDYLLYQSYDFKKLFQLP